MQTEASRTVRKARVIVVSGAGVRKLHGPKSQGGHKGPSPLGRGSYWMDLALSTAGWL